MYPNRRQHYRQNSNNPIELSFGSQVMLQGQLKDISNKSAFIALRSSVYFQQEDSLTFRIPFPENENLEILGEARISRISPGEGIAIYFINLDAKTTNTLEQFILKSS